MTGVSRVKKSKPTTLLEVCYGCREFALTVGVVLDATGPYTPSDSSMAFVKLKIIDQSFNPVKGSGGSVQPYLMIFLEAERRKRAPVPLSIGDVILCSSFNIYVNKHSYLDYLVAKPRASESRWIILDGSDPQRIVASSPGSPLNYLEYDLDNLLLWRSTFFSNNCLFGMCWFQNNRDFTGSLPKEVKIVLDADIIVQFLGEQEDGNRLFRDKENKLFFAKNHSIFESLVSKRVYKLRSVSFSNLPSRHPTEITWAEYSRWLAVPSEFRNAIEFQELAHPSGENIDRFTQDYNLQQSRNFAAASFLEDDKNANETLISEELPKRKGKITKLSNNNNKRSLSIRIRSAQSQRKYEKTKIVSSPVKKVPKDSKKRC